MEEKNTIERIVEQAVSEILEKQVPKLQRELVESVLQKIPPQLGAGSGDSGGGAAGLLQAIQTIHAGTTQKEVLRALLDCTVSWSGRAALFVVKAGTATGWQGRGFDDNDSIKDFSLDVSSPGPAEVLKGRVTVAGTTSEMDPNFVGQFGAPAKDRTLLMPLHLKDKVAAIVYADAGTQSDGSMDAPSLELLVAATSAWLEVAALRKQAQKDGAADPDSAEKLEAPVPVQSVPAFNDPFAGHAPTHARAAAVPVEEPVAEVAAAASATMSAAAPARATDAFAQLSTEDAEVHRKAQRFARLLMDEIKLYNQVKLTEGRKKKDLYDRLKEDIDKSRATFMKRYGNTVAANADYFVTELVRSLAEDDVSILGPNFHR